MQHQPFRSNSRTIPFLSFLIVALCILLASCDVNISTGGSNGTGGSSQCQSNCTTGSGAQGVKVFVEPDAGESVVVNAIGDAHKSVWLEMYLLSDTKVIHALEDDANRGIDVRVMLEPHPVGGGTSPSRTIDELKAAGIKAQYSDPEFSLTHEKGMIIDGTTAFIMTSNFTRAALGGYSGSSYLENREYDIIDTNTNDVQAVISIFNADWNHTTAQFNDPNLVVSPVNSRSDFNTLINSAHHTLLIEAEEMNDSSIEQELVNAEQRGVRVEVILPAPHGSQSDSNSQGIDTIKQGGVQVKEDAKLYMHAKIIVVDGKTAFVGSENISAQSLDRNRELGIIVSDAGVLSTLQSTFQYDWSVSHSV
ncbi:MAG TPA: phospholipase D-like domain-containing protein [Ktedonobacteraceae bacterium]|jgi:cardiolipin synthase|nr:phospholipase D-like domain-containing protein [Ktedonobacteraceae bacterium]